MLKITCNNKVDGDLCENEVWCYESHLLWCELTHRRTYSKQRLWQGICPKCWNQVMAWVGIKKSGLEESQVNLISPKKHERWEARKVTDKVQDYDPRGVGIVTGSRRSFPWSYSESIPVR